MSTRQKGLTRRLAAALFTGALVITSLLFMVFPAMAALSCQASYTGTAITIDGNLDAAWSGKVVNAITKLTLGSVTGDPDLSGNFGVLWDNTNLYLMADINDDTLKNDSTNGADDDSIDFYLDMNHNHSTTYGADDFMYQFGYSDSVVTEYKHNATTGVVVASVSRTGGYRLEAKIPWTTLAKTPTGNMTFGLDVMANDDDDGGTRDAQKAWNDGTGHAYENPSLFGDCTLLSASSPTPTVSPTNTPTATPTVTPTASGAVTYYRIQNRWLNTQYLYDGGTRVNYGTGTGDTYLWSLEDYSGYKRIKNKASGEYINIKNGETNVECTVITASDTTSHWTIAAVSGAPAEWKAIVSRSNSKYVNVEQQLGYVECDLTSVPDNNNWWSEQWNLLISSGSTPTPTVSSAVTPTVTPTATATATATTSALATPTAPGGSYTIHRVTVTNPAYRSDVTGSIWIAFYAPSMNTATVKCWQQGGTYGSDSTVGTVTLDANGYGAVRFIAANYPHGPIHVRISATDGTNNDVCSLQLYNTVGVSWNEGVPAAPPPAAGMSLVYSDDFNGPLSISSTGSGATYCSHKVGGGDFGNTPFGNYEGPNNPFSQRDSYMRIRCNTNSGVNTTGLISSERMDGTGIMTMYPSYFECRFICQNAIGSWPAFWVMTKNHYLGLSTPSDELDTIEAYGVADLFHQNQTGYWIASHTWNQTPGQPSIYQHVSQTPLGGGGNWGTNFHVYGQKITATDTIYYMDNIEVGRHGTTNLCKQEPIMFYINLATGGGWPVDFARYGNIVDMWVDYVRVYH